MRAVFFSLLNHLEYIDILLWGALGVPLVIGLGLYLSWKSCFFQFRALPKAFREMFFEKPDGPLCLAFFASLGGSVGVGNVVGVCMALQAGGPGSIFWLWLGAITGTLLKYSEVYLAMLFKGKHNGMASYILAAFGSIRIAQLAAFLSCIYGVEIYQFNIIRDLIHETWNIPCTIVSALLLTAILLGIRNGIRGVGEIASKIIPSLLFFYFLASLITLYVFRANFFNSLQEIFSGVFYPPTINSGGLFAFLTTAAQGMARGCYASDVGIGYSGIVYSSTSTDNPSKKARSILLEPFFDSFGVSTISLFVVLVTGVWKESSTSGFLVEQALSKALPYVKPLFTILLTLLGYSTIITFLVTGIESARFIGGEKNVSRYLSLAACSWIWFSFFEARVALVFMSLCGFLLLMINVFSFIALRKHIEFNESSTKQ